jgi:hypothetical protein
MMLTGGIVFDDGKSQRDETRDGGLGADVCAVVGFTGAVVPVAVTVRSSQLAA